MFLGYFQKNRIAEIISLNRMDTEMADEFRFDGLFKNPTNGCKSKAVSEELENVSIEMEKLRSLLSLLESYFEHGSPSSAFIAANYKTYANLYFVINDMVIRQSKVIDGLLEKMQGSYCNCNH